MALQRADGKSRVYIAKQRLNNAVPNMVDPLGGKYLTEVWLARRPLLIGRCTAMAFIVLLLNTCIGDIGESFGA